MSIPRSNLEWFAYADGPIGPAADSQHVAKVVSSARLFLAALDSSRSAVCMRAALAFACRSATLFKPRFATPAVAHWFGPDGKPAPKVDFPADFVDRRQVVSWSLYRLTLGRAKDEPIFSAQARLTMHDDSFYSFKNYGKPAASLMADKSVLSLEHSAPESAPMAHPSVRVLMHQANGFEDIIFYTAVFNFSRALCAFLTGPWPALREVMTDQRSILDVIAASPAEARAIGRAALAATEAAWDAVYQSPLAANGESMLALLTQAIMESQP